MQTADKNGSSKTAFNGQKYRSQLDKTCGLTNTFLDKNIRGRLRFYYNSDLTKLNADDGFKAFKFFNSVAV